MLTNDRKAEAQDRATWTVEQIGRTQSLTPEGFLLCEGVRIARTGPMLYAPAEMPEIEPSGGVMITVLRDAEVLFAEETIQSFAGKPVTNDHPTAPVTPETFKDVAAGVVLNPRRGEGVEADYLVADLLITDADAIQDIQGGKREVSCGYDVDVEQIKPGLGRQIRVVGNHVALVDRGRAGPSCSIQDRETPMKKRTAWDRLRTAFKAKDEAAFEEELEAAQKEASDDAEEGGSRHEIVIRHEMPEAKEKAEDAEEGEGESDPNEERFAKLEAAVTKLAEAVGKMQNAERAEAEETLSDDDPELMGEGETVEDEGAEEDDPAKEESEGEAKDEKSCAMDAAALAREFKDVRTKAEILSPGLMVKAFDAFKAKDTASTLVRRASLTRAFADPARRKHVEAVLGGRKAAFDKMAANQVAIVFDAAAALARSANNASSVRGAGDVPQGPMTAAKLQERIQAKRAAQV